MITVLKGNIVAVPTLGQLDITENGYLVAEDGQVAGVFRQLPEQYKNAEVEDWGDALILQAPADMHVHGPQFAMMGLGMDLPLLEWLQRYAFPTERRFADPGFAREVYQRLAFELVKNGTTRVAMFSSLHWDTTLILMEELEKAGITGFVGKVNMDQNGGDGLQETAESSLADTLRWLEGCGRFSRVRPMLTPRFIPSCSNKVLAGLGKLAAERDLPIQSHLSENHGEIQLVAQLHPDTQRYWEAYAKFGLWTNKTLMAHCVHSDEAERKAMKDAGVTVVHCPNSNNSICSGIAPVRKMLDEGLRVALGTDVAGGSHLSMFGAVEDALRCSKDRRILDNWETEHLTVAEGWYLATTAAEQFFGAKGGFSPGDPLHALVLDDSRLIDPYPLSVRDRFERCIYRRQPHAIRAIWSEGRKIKG